MTSNCSGGWGCDGSRPATAADNRAYEAAIRARGGRNSPGGRAYIDQQHALFRASTQHHREMRGGCLAITVALLAVPPSIATAVYTWLA